MPRQSLAKTARQTRTLHLRLRKPTSKELDMVLLAGCSCLITLLHHPVGEALQTAAQKQAANTPTTQTSRVPLKTGGQFFLTLPPQRERVQLEEEEA